MVDLLKPRTGHCWHCGRRLGGAVCSYRRGDYVFHYHGDRRACRIAGRESFGADKPGVVMPPERIGGMRTETFGAALAGFDYIRWPWWIRWAPERWIDAMRYEVALKVGGIVERRCFLVQNGLDGDDDG
jgi:hypothetical protein